MNKRYAIDEQGRLRFEVYLHGLDEESPELVAEPLPTGLRRPRWTGKEWQESASEEDRCGRLERHRLHSLHRLAEEAEAVREAFSPAGPHALAVREQRLREARSFLYGRADEDLLILGAESEAAGVELKALAATVIEEHQAWGKRMGQIEAVLRRNRELLRAAKEQAALDELLDAGRDALRALLRP